MLLPFYLQIFKTLAGKTGVKLLGFSLLFFVGFQFVNTHVRYKQIQSSCGLVSSKLRNQIKILLDKSNDFAVM